MTRFNAQDLEPDYWLAEGYAVMDVEGNPYNNVDEHCQMPQAMDCYVAAYKWAIEHYNLCRDGVFLGGRSMGGGMTISLLRRQCPIPVIAACPNAAALTMPLHIVDLYFLKDLHLVMGVLLLKSKCFLITGTSGLKLFLCLR